MSKIVLLSQKLSNLILFFFILKPSLTYKDKIIGTYMLHICYRSADCFLYGFNMCNVQYMFMI